MEDKDTKVMGVPNRMDIGQAGDNNPDSANEAYAMQVEEACSPEFSEGCKTVKE
ncbi:MAG TPA: hypothetical protein PK127_00025 [Clostridiales bacterium]|jgi:hypothetical protein|nr:hypothetical protein [Clostridiaceae bacterium]HOQ06615.1 hypothetical protein [Clostridiales bacterium]HPV00851.1 hypothetical protein [Clostridiales bacterium]